MLVFGLGPGLTPGRLGPWGHFMVTTRGDQTSWILGRSEITSTAEIPDFFFFIFTTFLFSGIVENLTIGFIYFEVSSELKLAVGDFFFPFFIFNVLHKMEKNYKYRLY